MIAAQYADLIRATLARLTLLDGDRAADVRAELCLGACLAEAVSRGLVRGVTHAGRAALVFTVAAEIGRAPMTARRYLSAARARMAATGPAVAAA
ncbi:hypothetical protein M8C11_18850 [Micromonospora sp. CPM1]|uniref:hypothetical protein n=1 Tax=Micromonospora sp. CPM1 TaxID=2944809 RepID=UPI00207C6C9D|nr:hypothetical protein [Micromonospora sp. CPM1]MCO1616776.1 hypothetical protein [Micromonospora sp. CPM1]